MVSLQLFGGASLTSDGATLPGPPAQRHRLALLALLCLSHPRPVSRDKLMAYLWPERDVEHARNLLKQAVHVLRRALGDDAIVSAGDELRLGSAHLDCDVLAFEEALARGELERAVALYAGPLLDGFFLSDAPEFEHRVDQERERLRRAWRTAAGTVAEDRLAAGDEAGAAECWRRLVADEPHDPRATLGLMQALEATGDRAGAMRQARLHEILLQQDYGAGPDAEVRALAERIRAGSGRRTAAEPPARAEPARAEVASGPAAPLTRARRSRSRMGAALVSALLIVGAAAWVAARGAAPKAGPITRIAVLPLANLTGDPGQEYFVAGMHDALISELAQIEALTVYSRQSVLRYDRSNTPMPDVAKELGVDAVVEGAVFKSGDSVRISVQLVRTEPERHLIAQTFTGPLSRALALQGEVARAVADAMRARVTPAVRARLAQGRTVDPAAQEAYLSGLYHLERAAYAQFLPAPERAAAVQRAVAKLEDAVALDPGWAAAHGKLALAYHWLASHSPDYQSEYFPKSKRAALQALAIDSTESQAYASLGFVLSQYEWDWAGGEQAIRRAIELEPNSHHWIYAIYLSTAGRHDEAIAQYRLAEARDPMSEILKSQVAWEYACAGRYREAIALTRALHAQASAAGVAGGAGDSVSMLFRLSRMYSLAGVHDTATAAAERLLAMTDTGSNGAVLSFVHAMAGRGDEARALLARVEAIAPDRAEQWRPEIYAALGDTARAIAATDSAVRKLGRRLAGIRCWPSFMLLGDHPQMRALVQHVGFPDWAER